MNDNGGGGPKSHQVSRLSELAEAHVEVARPDLETASEDVAARAVPQAEQADGIAEARRRFARLLGEFRRTAVLVPFDDQDSLWTADFNGVRWICAFSDEEALGRFAAARGDAGREWTYRTILGARLLDVMVPMLPGPGGVALDAGSADGMVFPPVAGIVPDEAAVDLEDTVDLGGTGTR
ncbi:MULTISPECIES: SseB family protein [unclassified Streptomyces]|uniref:SseB family protein n=1 Tax=unclassified Streptomyces TaxID=2593676 RepID=UPI0035A82C4A